MPPTSFTFLVSSGGHGKKQTSAHNTFPMLLATFGTCPDLALL